MKILSNVNLQYVFDFVKGLGTRNLVDKIEYFTKLNIFNIVVFVELKIFNFTKLNTSQNRSSQNRIHTV